MNLEKVCHALSQTDTLGDSLVEGCAIAQLFYAAGKTPVELNTVAGYYQEAFDDLLAKTYGMDKDDVETMVAFNDRYLGSETERQKLVLAKYEEMLIESLISEPVLETV